LRYEIFRKLLFKLGSEKSYDLSMKILEFGNKNPWIFQIIGNNYRVKDEILHQKILGLDFHNPIGLGAGLDRNGVALEALQTVGFGAVEIGTVTPKPQDKNVEQRMDLLEKNRSVQRYVGFESRGMEVVKRNLSKFNVTIPVSISIARNNNTSNEDTIKDYEALVTTLANSCDIFTINLSSPSTPKLQKLQSIEFIKELFVRLTKLTNNPIAFKISPDFDYEDALVLCKAAVDSGAKILIISDSSSDYNLSPNIKEHKGGVSGKLLTHKSREFLRAISKEFFKKAVIVSSGGIDNAEEAYERIKLGASLVQIYSSFVFEGPEITKELNKGIIELLKADGYSNISEAVGVDIKFDTQKEEPIELVQEGR